MVTTRKVKLLLDSWPGIMILKQSGNQPKPVEQLNSFNTVGIFGEGCGQKELPKGESTQLLHVFVISSCLFSGTEGSKVCTEPITVLVLLQYSPFPYFPSTTVSYLVTWLSSSYILCVLGAGHLQCLCLVVVPCILYIRINAQATYHARCCKDGY